MRSRSTVSFVATSHNPPPIDTLPITTSTIPGQHQRLRIYPYSKREQSPADLHNFLEAVRIGDFGLGSDGSVKGLSTTYSSRIQSRSKLHIFINSHSKFEPTSTLRAEAMATLTASTFFVQPSPTSFPTVIPSLYHPPTNTWTI